MQDMGDQLIIVKQGPKKVCNRIISTTMLARLSKKFPSCWRGVICKTTEYSGPLVRHQS